MPDALVDTDVLVDHLRGARALVAPFPVAYSVITRCELFAGRGAEEDRVRELLALMREIPVERAVAERAGRLRRELAIRTPDALIAASALEAGLALLTRNRRDFACVPGLAMPEPPDPGR